MIFKSKSSVIEICRSELDTIQKKSIMIHITNLMLLVTLLPLCLGAPVEDSTSDSELERSQNENAKYSFGINVDDKISDLTQHHQEDRNGLLVTGQYSYSDGFVRRTVYYEADDKGYRVTSQKVEVLTEDGPKVNPEGSASVDIKHANGRVLHYRIHQVKVPSARVIVSDEDQEHYKMT